MWNDQFFLMLATYTFKTFGLGLHYKILQNQNLQENDRFCAKLAPFQLLVTRTQAYYRICNALKVQ